MITVKNSVKRIILVSIVVLLLVGSLLLGLKLKRDSYNTSDEYSKLINENSSEETKFVLQDYNIMFPHALNAWKSMSTEGDPKTNALQNTKLLLSVSPFSKFVDSNYELWQASEREIVIKFTTEDGEWLLVSCDGYGGVPFAMTKASFTEIETYFITGEANYYEKENADNTVTLYFG